MHRSIPQRQKTRYWLPSAYVDVRIVKMSKFQRIIFWLFAVLLFFVPLVLWPYTSEVFEFNKIVLTYALTVLISGAWIVRMISERKFIFRRTILDLPLLLFLASQVISTLLSIDPYTSVFGYYSRFNGGLLSTISYLLLYWAFVSNFDKKDTVKIINYSLLPGAFVVSAYAVLEHFGIDKNIWVQDVQSRVFSTLGQPNWLAAFVGALIPITWALALESRVKSKNFFIYFSLSVLFFWTLIFTKSRSGFFGLGIATIIFWGLILYRNGKKLSDIAAPFIIIGVSFIAVCLISGTQWTPGLSSLINKPKEKQVVTQTAGTALETGGTESGTIRRIVWKGALQIFAHYPIFGTGVETFAYSYYLFRPQEHNLTSEWDFIYNKAHNEFLNFAANTGTVGLLSYLAVIGFSIYLILKSKTDTPYFKYGLAAGFISLSASNFFGFSVVPTQLEFFLFPAIAVALERESKRAEEYKFSKITNMQKLGILASCSLALMLLYSVLNYWYADILYTKAKAENGAKRPDLAVPLLDEAEKLEPGQAIYFAEQSVSYSTIAMAYDQAKDATGAAQFSNLADSQIQKAVFLSPANVNIRRQMFGIYVRLSTINENYLIVARDSLLDTIKLAPTDAKLYYNLGIADANLGETVKAKANFQKAIGLKVNYADARVQYAALLTHLKQNDEAKQQLIYVLNNIDPSNSTAKQALENIK